MTVDLYLNFYDLRVSGSSFRTNSKRDFYRSGLGDQANLMDVIVRMTIGMLVWRKAFKISNKKSLKNELVELLCDKWKLCTSHYMNTLFEFKITSGAAGKPSPSTSLSRYTKLFWEKTQLMMNIFVNIFSLPSPLLTLDALRGYSHHSQRVVESFVSGSSTTFVPFDKREFGIFNMIGVYVRFYYFYCF